MLAKVATSVADVDQRLHVYASLRRVWSSQGSAPGDAVPFSTCMIPLHASLLLSSSGYTLVVFAVLRKTLSLFLPDHHRSGNVPRSFFESVVQSVLPLFAKIQNFGSSTCLYSLFVRSPKSVFTLFVTKASRGLDAPHSAFLHVAKRRNKEPTLLDSLEVIERPVRRISNDTTAG